MFRILASICAVVSFGVLTAEFSHASEGEKEFEFSKTAWTTLNLESEGKKYCVLGIKPIRSSQGFDANQVQITYSPQIQNVAIVTEEQEFRSEQGYLAGRHVSYPMTFSGLVGFLWPSDGGGSFYEVAIESPRMKIVSGQIWVEFRNTGFVNAFEKAGRFCDLQ